MNPMTNRLTRLLALNRSAPRAYKAEAAGEEATIFMYDVIGYDWWSDGGITAKDFAKDLAALEAAGVKTVHLRINSPGGDVFEGRAIVAAMQRTKMKLVAHIDGLAASAASFIAVHAHEVEITDGAFIMIHNGWTIAVGDRHAFTETAALLEKIDGSIADDYAKKTGMDKAELSALMDAETWFSAADAVANKFADRIAEPAATTANASTWDLGAYDRAPAALCNAPHPMPPRDALAPAAPMPEPEPEPDFTAQHAHRLRALQMVETAHA